MNLKVNESRHRNITSPMLLKNQLKLEKNTNISGGE